MLPIHILICCLFIYSYVAYSYTHMLPIHILICCLFIYSYVNYSYTHMLLINVQSFSKTYPFFTIKRSTIIIKNK